MIQDDYMKPSIDYSMEWNIQNANITIHRTFKMEYYGVLVIKEQIGASVLTVYQKSIGNTNDI